MKKIFIVLSLFLLTACTQNLDQITDNRVKNVSENSDNKEIIVYLDNYRVEINTLISKYQKQIELMQEYRTSLISQAVTGKIDVRDWEPKGDEEKVVN